MQVNEKKKKKIKLYVRGGSGLIFGLKKEEEIIVYKWTCNSNKQEQKPFCYFQMASKFHHFCHLNKLDGLIC